MKTQKIILFAALVFASLNTFAQGPWTKGKGKGYFQVGLSSFFYDKIKLEGKDVDLAVDVSDITTQVYAEYGLTDKFDLSLGLPIKSFSVKNKITSNSQSVSGLGNVSIGLKYKLYDADWKIAAGLQYSGNTATKNKDNDLRTGFGANTYLPYVSAGKSHGKMYYFANIGYGYMSNEYTDFFKVGGEFGYKFLQNTHAILNLEIHAPLGEEAYYKTLDNLFSSSISNFNDKQCFFAIGLKINHEFVAEKFGANLGAIGAFSQDNLPLATTINLGIYYKL